MFHFGILFLVLINYFTDFVTSGTSEGQRNGTNEGQQNGTYQGQQNGTYQWQYSGKNGPESWTSHYATCGGMAQSPINIPLAESVTYDSNLEPFTLNGFKESLTFQMVNNGHTAKLSIFGTVDIEGGGLSQKYRTAQLHFHWGNSSTMGSEHLYNEMAYPLEMHVVNFNSKYENFTMAVNESDGLAVLGFWFKVSDEDNTKFTPLLNHLKNIEYEDEDDGVTDVVLNDLVLPKLDRYYRYKGSLTSPPCFESITWSVFEEPIPISENQLDLFRSLYKKPKDHDKNHKLSNNFRPVQNLNNRMITRSFNLDTESTTDSTTDSGTSHICASSLATVLIVYFLHHL